MLFIIDIMYNTLNIYMCYIYYYMCMLIYVLLHIYIHYLYVNMNESRYILKIIEIFVCRV